MYGFFCDNIIFCKLIILWSTRASCCFPCVRGLCRFFREEARGFIHKRKERAKLPSRAALKLSIDSYVGRWASQSQKFTRNERNHTYSVFVEVCVMGVEETT
jgi:hypothetical protein